MNRQREALDLASALLEDVELKRIKASEIVLKASRLARLVGHDDLCEFLSFEREGYPTDGSAGRWVTRAGRWSDSAKTKLYAVSVAEIEALMTSSSQAIEALRGGGNYSGEWASIAGREHDQRITGKAETVGVLEGICGRVVATVYDMVVDIYHELMFSDLQATLFASTQVTVDGALAEAGGSALTKIERVSDRLRDGDPESVSQALTTCRRLIDACANHLFPGQGDPYQLNNGVDLKVTEQNVLNRLQAYTDSVGISKSRHDRIRRAMSDLYERCSAGTHSEVSVQEARFVFLQTYVLLGEVLTLSAAE